MKLDLAQLWFNTFANGRPTSDTQRLRALAEAHLATACLLRDDTQTPIEAWPSYDTFLGEDYGKFTGARETGERFARRYLGSMKIYSDSFRKHGFDPARSRLTVEQGADGCWRMIDGNRRIAIMMAQSCGPEIEVQAGDRRFTGRTCRAALDKVLPQSPFVIEDRRVLYQPVAGFGEYSHPVRSKMFLRALDTVLSLVGSAAGKQILDIGSCFGFFSFELARRGARCVGLEQDGNRLAVCRQLSAHYSMDWSNPLWCFVPAESFLQATRRCWDWVLMLSVFHCMWRDNQARATATLRRAIRLAEGGVILSTDHNGICGSQQNVGAFLRRVVPTAHVAPAGEACGRRLFVLSSS